jgi:adiponectin receptor
MSHSQAVYDAGIKLDFQGVLVLMYSSTVPLIYYSFPCSLRLQTLYFAATTLLAALVSAATLHPVMGAVHLGHHRARLFSAFGIGSFVIPIAHCLLRDGTVIGARRVGVPWVLATTGWNTLGMGIYSFKVRLLLY